VGEKENLIRSMLLPDSLETSKVIAFMNEDMTFNVEDLYNHKDVKKLFETKEELIKVLEGVNYVKLDQNKGTCTIVIKDEMAIYSLINFPPKLTKDDLEKELGLEGKNYFSRIYKKYVVWLLVAEDNTAETDKFEDKLKKIQCGDEKLRYEITTGKNLKKLILKRINYNKESSDLKATPATNDKLSCPAETISWRKKSGEGEDLSAKKFPKGNDKYSNNNKDTNNFKRKRFNSDGADDNLGAQNDVYKANEKIVPSDKIKHRYSIKEMNDLFAGFVKSQNVPPKFTNNIEEICMLEMRKTIPTFEALINDSKRDRSKTMNYQPYEFYSDKKNIPLPKNNPLQDASNFEFSSGSKSHVKKNDYNSNTYKNKFDFAN